MGCIGKVDTADLIAFHIELLEPWIGDLGVDEVYDETLQPFKDHRLKPTVTKTGKPKQVSLTTLNRSLEIVRRILNLCARSYRHPNRMTYLETAPLITIERNKPGYYVVAGGRMTQTGAQSLAKSCSKK